MGCKDVRDTTLVILNRIGTLERLVLDHCNHLEVAHFTLPHLHTLSLHSCRGLKELSVDTASLTSIDPNECQALATVELHAVSLPRLQLDHLIALRTVRNDNTLTRSPYFHRTELWAREGTEEDRRLATNSNALRDTSPLKPHAVCLSHTLQVRSPP